MAKALLKIENKDLSTGMLQVETDVSRYVELLCQLKKYYLIILSVRDTPGECLPEDAIRAIREFGFTQFSKELWRMYIGVSCRGNILCNTTGESREAPVSYQYDEGVEIAVSSMAWRQGNIAEIFVNGINYAINMRGLNFVVYGLEKKQLVDSIGFDYHTGRDIFKRR